MTQFYDRGLKAKDQSTLETALVAVGIDIASDEISYYFIGPLTLTDTVFDDDFHVLTPATYTTDVYANIRVDADSPLPYALESQFVDTSTPMVQDGATASYSMDLRIPLTATWA